MHQEIKYLLAKVDKGEATPAEAAQLRELLDTGGQDFDDLLRTEWKNPEAQSFSESEKQAHQAELQQLLLRKSSRQRRIYPFLAAASILLLFVVGFSLLTKQDKGGAAAGAKLVVESNEGETVRILNLPDGSQVWLAPNATLRYPATFANTLRAVSLEGEAYFDVASNPNHPFEVSAGETVTRVLGTEFNVVNTDELVAITLVEGSVAVRTPGPAAVPDTTLLVPGEQLAFVATDRSLRKVKTDPARATAWKEGWMVFDGATENEVAHSLARRYGVRIEVSAGFSSRSELVHRFNTDQTSLNEALRGIETVTDYRFQQLKENHYLIIPKPE